MVYEVIIIIIIIFLSEGEKEEETLCSKKKNKKENVKKTLWLIFMRCRKRKVRNQFSGYKFYNCWRFFGFSPFFLIYQTLYSVQKCNINKSKIIDKNTCSLFVLWFYVVSRLVLEFEKAFINCIILFISENVVVGCVFFLMTFNKPLLKTK